MDRTVMINQNGKSNRELATEMSLRGMSMKEVSVALGIPYRTVYGWLRGRKAASSAGHNADGHLCKTCKYRVGSYERSRTGMNCNYCYLIGHSRGCKVAECNVYEKGNMARTRKTMRLKRKGTT